jgi:hypothetical protein
VSGALLFTGLLVFAIGCGAAAPYAPTPQTVICYAVADSNAQARVNAECKVSDTEVDISTCASRESIMAELKAAQEACPQ